MGSSSAARSQLINKPTVGLVSAVALSLGALRFVRKDIGV
jgi:hypothetical protein